VKKAKEKPKKKRGILATIVLALYLSAQFTPTNFMIG
jgi:hypothetical protein